MCGEKTLPKVIQWAGTNVSEHHPQCCESNHRQGSFLCRTLHRSSSFVDTILSPSYHREKTFALNQLFQLGRVDFFRYYRGQLVRCPSGLRSTPGKCVYVCAYRGFESLSHRQNFKDLNRKIKVFFYTEHSYLDLAQSLLYKNDSSTNRIICTTKWNIYSKISAWTWFKLELKQFLREVKINHQWSSRCNVYEAQFICGI